VYYLGSLFRNKLPNGIIDQDPDRSISVNLKKVMLYLLSLNGTMDFWNEPPMIIIKYLCIFYWTNFLTNSIYEIRISVQNNKRR